MATDSLLKNRGTAVSRTSGVQVEAGITPAAATVELDGLWSRYAGMSEGDPVRFWYFHGDGHGLYRYGRIGYTNTHSFDYVVNGDQLELRFRKSGESYRTKVEVKERDGRRELRMAADPRDPGARYTWAREPIAASAASTAAAEDAPFSERMWIDFRSYATGGSGFRMYQFGPAAIDGRGVGWFHEGDFDDWRTEALSYRIDGERIELFFDLNGELGVTEFSFETEDRGRILVLDEDPRDFWLTHRYRDAGRSFGEPAFVPMAWAGATPTALGGATSTP